MARRAADLPVAILAGGLATRLLPITERVPKLLVEVAGELFFSHQLRLLKEAGLTRLVLCVGHLGEMIVENYGDGARWGVQIDYSFDGPAPLGTGGAIIRALTKLGDAFYVLYGDSYLPINYLDVGQSFLVSGKQGMMTIFENCNRYDVSNVWFEDGRIRTYDKKNRVPQMKHVDYGLGLLRADALTDWPRGSTVDLADVYRRLVEKDELAGYEVRQRFYEIGSHTGLRELDQMLRSSQHNLSEHLLCTRGPMSYAVQHLKEVSEIASRINPADCEKCVAELVDVRSRGGRVFILGVGGSAANASHAVNDFRKIAGLECYAPTDNVSELTARTNDDGWTSVFVEWLRGSRLNAKDALLILSVGGGNLKENISPNLVTALQYAKQVGARAIGIVGKDGGYTAQVADACVIIPTISPNNVTPHSEAFQAVLWHLFVSHPDLKINQTKWESVVCNP
jgi:D-sedoheptulose 7-phosphate isomerase